MPKQLIQVSIGMEVPAIQVFIVLFKFLLARNTNGAA